MIYIWLNLWPILVATGLGLAIGAVWTRAGGVAVSTAMGAIAALALFWIAAILAGAVILAPAGDNPWIMALGSAFIIWVGFVAPVLIVTLRVRGERIAPIVAIVAYWLVAMLAQVAAMQAIGLTALPT